MSGIIKWFKSLLRKQKIGFEPIDNEMIVTLRAPIYPKKGGTQSLIVDTQKEPVKNLAEYLGFKEEKIVDWLMDNSGFKKMLFEKLLSGKKKCALLYNCSRTIYTE